MKQTNDGIYEDQGILYTENLVEGTKVYGERLVKKDGKEYREWIPERSKLAAAIKNKMITIPLQEGSIVMYLGASAGTTVSHVSDIVKEKGIVYGLEFAERVFRKLAEISQQRKNIAPLYFDARLPEKYSWIEMCDLVFSDLSQPDQTEIALRNADMFLKEGKYLLIVIKARSIDVTKDPKKLYREEADKIENAGYKITEIINLEPYEDSHAIIIAKKV